MKIVATVAEYNPLHTGHLYHIESAKRELSPNAFVVVQSGNFCERGDAAIIEKHKRAETAIAAGADIVIELPFFYAVNCAEKFAEGAMKTLSCLGEPLTLTFGSECGDITKLKTLSDKTHNETEADKNKIKEGLDSGLGLVKARAEALDNDGDFTPNNVLALEYIHYAKKYGFDVHTIPRDVGYNDENLSGKYASANAIRNNILNGNFDKISRFLPDFTVRQLDNCIGNDALTDLILYKLNLMKTSDIKDLNEVIEGLENRIKNTAKTAKTYDELIGGIKSKRYTMARIKRIMLYALTDLTKSRADALYQTEPYARVLAVREGRADLLSMIAACSNLIIRSKDVAAMPKSVQDAIEFENVVDAVYSVASKRPAEFKAVFVK